MILRILQDNSDVMFWVLWFLVLATLASFMKK